jgi:hypothetical protein
MRFLIGCILGLAALTPFAVLATRTLSVPTPPTNIVVAAVDTRDCTPYNNSLRAANPWCQAGKLERQTKR